MTTPVGDPAADGGGWPVVCATGPRPQHLPPGTQPWVRAKLDAAARWCRDQRGTTVGLSGMAIGVDLWWAQAVLDAGLTLGACVPCPQQPDRWSPDWQAMWRRLLGQADPAWTVTIARRYHPSVMHARNRAMVSAAAGVLCVQDPARQAGGTFHAVGVAHLLRRPGVWLDPAARTVRVGLPPHPLQP